ncbi:DNA-directed RNA polymerase subunit beta' [Candidatus Izimaplasma bacterium HR1]|jgi:DNA-directed RNA polymerase subunit beta'|uniref:DNA-directed RNA polymerase subunit beta' n=1 Tax=Candidatus Izimoplasma sp. HR1 TaxID=1541959 RepID=UPI0004F6BC66|nr:DNA-directed RNA polymerase subunit beta' [Candidatus Izimaplasma bacterium HR1]
MSQRFSHYKIRLASPEEIRGWSFGEVKKHETINYRTLKPEKDGLFCEVIFGPTKDYQCACNNKSKRSSHTGKKCQVCGVEITESKVRRERMGHIELAAPVVHTWYLRNSPSRLATLLAIKAKDLEEVVYLASYIVIEPGDTDLQFKQILSEADYSVKYMEYGSRFKALSGAEAVKVLLKKLDLKKESLILRSELPTASKQKREKIIKRLEIVEAFLKSDNKPEWMVLDVLPVIPPELRPMVQLDGGRFATTDLNDLYRRILNRNNRLKRQFEQNAPHLITKNEKRMLQEAVDALIDNSKRGRKVVEKNRPLKSLSDLLRGKQGRFRQNLLGKRVDYSGRSVIVVGPDLEMYQCGLPKEMAVTLFKPFVIKELIEREIASNIKSAKRLVEQLQDERIWDVVEDVIREHPVLLNRAPTLHRLGIQAFEPKLVEGKAIRLHPLVTTAFNADFDGDQMAVHVPLSEEAQAEARVLMLASNNILNPKDGKPIVTPSQDMVLGNYYLTQEKAGEVGEGSVYSRVDEATIAYENKFITLHTRIAIKGSALGNAPLTDDQRKGYLVTTYGKLYFNSILPKEFAYLNEPTLTNLQKQKNPETGEEKYVTPQKFFVPRGTDIREFVKAQPLVSPFKKGFLSQIISEVFVVFKINETSKMLDKLKNLGFKFSTQAGITVSASDVQVYSKKVEEVERTQKIVDSLHQQYDMGLLTDYERYKLVIKEWADVKSKIQKGLMKELTSDNHIFMMSDSGARGNASNFTQLAGMRGSMANTKREGLNTAYNIKAGIKSTIELPVKSSFIEGLTMSEFFISTHGARKGSTDTALKTADSGYLTRRLVDVSQDLVITEEDCHTDNGVTIREITHADGKEIVPFLDRLIGRYAAENAVHPDTGEILVGKNEYITDETAKQICDAGIVELRIRSVLTCDSNRGICKKCYGQNLSTGSQVEVGESVGTIAAQSIGEPGTQLTMRTFHTGGVAGADITQGLPRIQELFEARTPKGKAVISEIDGTVSDIEIVEERYKVTVENGLEQHVYETNSGVTLLVEEGDDVTAGTKITDGSIDPKQLLKATDAETTQQYILKEVQKVYRAQGIEISDKHIEIIIHQMMKKINVIIEGDTKLLPGAQVSVREFKVANRETLAKRLKPAVGRPALLGITRASLRSESFLSAASFQETTRVLTDAAIRGKVDELVGLKENVIIGGLIPAGTGILRDTKFEYEKEPLEEEVLETPQDENPFVMDDYQF